MIFIVDSNLSRTRVEFFLRKTIALKVDGKRLGPTSTRNAARERSRVQSLRGAFRSLQASLPAVPPDTKLSKLDVLTLAAAYIAHLVRLLDHAHVPQRPRDADAHRLHPLKVVRKTLCCLTALYLVVDVNEQELAAEVTISQEYCNQSRIIKN